MRWSPSSPRSSTARARVCGCKGSRRLGRTPIHSTLPSPIVPRYRSRGVLRSDMTNSCRVTIGGDSQDQPSLRSRPPGSQSITPTRRVSTGLGKSELAGSRCPGVTTDGFVSSKQVIRSVIVGVTRTVSVYRPLANRKEGHSGDDSVASGMPYRRKHIGVRVCKRPVISGACQSAPFEREEAL